MRKNKNLVLEKVLLSVVQAATLVQHGQQEQQLRDWRLGRIRTTEDCDLVSERSSARARTRQRGTFFNLSLGSLRARQGRLGVQTRGGLTVQGL